MASDPNARNVTITFMDGKVEVRLRSITFLVGPRKSSYVLNLAAIKSFYVCT